MHMVKDAIVIYRIHETVLIIVCMKDRCIVFWALVNLPNQAKNVIQAHRKIILQCNNTWNMNYNSSMAAQHVHVRRYLKHSISNSPLDSTIVQKQI